MRSLSLVPSFLVVRINTLPPSLVPVDAPPWRKRLFPESSLVLIAIPAERYPSFALPRIKSPRTTPKYPPVTGSKPFEEESNIPEPSEIFPSSLFTRVNILFPVIPSERRDIIDSESFAFMSRSALLNILSKTDILSSFVPISRPDLVMLT